MYNQSPVPNEITQLLFQPVQFRIDQPPIIPMVQLSNPNLQNFLPAISSILLNEISSKASTNPLRTLHFNLCFNNNFNNNYFTIAFGLAVDLLDFNLSQGVQSPVEQLLQDACQKAALFSCTALLPSPGYNRILSQVLQPNTVHDANNVLVALSNYENSIQRMKASRGMPQPMQQPNQFTQYPQNNFPVQQQSFGTYPNTGVQQNFQTQGSVFTSGTLAAPAGTISVGSRYAEYQPKFEQKPQFDTTQQMAKPYNDLQVSVRSVPVQPVVENKPAQVNEIEYDEVAVWVYSDENPYPPAINPNKEKLVSRTYQKYDGANGFKTVTETFVIPRSKEDMDRSQHTITSIAQAFTSHIPQGSATREEAIEKALKSKIPSNLAVVEKTDDLTEVVVGEDWIAKTFVEDAIQTTRILQCNQDPEDCQTYRSYNIVMPTFISRKPQTQILKHLSKSTNLSQLAERMRGFLTSEHSTETHTFIFDLDRFICKELVKFLNGKLCVNLKSMSCFIDDHGDLPMFISNSTSAGALEVFQKNEFAFISSILRPVTCAELEEGLINEDMPNVHFTATENYYSITCIAILAEELNIELHQPEYGNSSLIRQSSNPALFMFAKNLFEEAKGRDQNFAHHLVVTSDQKYFEIHKAILGYEENYLISKFTI